MKGIKMLTATAAAMFYVLITAWGASVFADAGSEWYLALGKPSFVPSAQLFSMAWLTIYLIITAIIAFLLLDKNTKALIFVCAVCVLNVLWTAVFFLWHIPAIALAVLALIFAADTAVLFWLAVHKKWQAAVFSPVLLWYGFLLILNYIIVLTN